MIMLVHLRNLGTQNADQCFTHESQTILQIIGPDCTRMNLENNLRSMDFLSTYWTYLGVSFPKSIYIGYR